MEEFIGPFIDFWAYVQSNMTLWDVVDILLVALGIYWLLMLIRGTRAIQIILGLLLLITASLASQLFQLSTMSWILENFLGSAVLIIIVLFQHDIRRALARVGGGFFPSVSAREESQILEEVVQAAKALSQKRVGALVVLERDNNLDEAVETGMFLDAAVSKEMLVSLFLPYSPLHDGAVIIQKGRVSHAGCILPLTLRLDLPEGLGTRHRAALGITEETDAVVIVVSEETSMISVVMGGEITRGLDAPELRVVLQDILTGERRSLSQMPKPVVTSGDNPLMRTISVDESETDEQETEPELETDELTDLAKVTEG
ncbi:MAG: TIGR00159 family protein [Deltaproteobacteria bacterium]|nr:TIGR00159 family protein [Deltaproteobacteria bacterium]